MTGCILELRERRGLDHVSRKSNVQELKEGAPDLDEDWCIVKYYRQEKRIDEVIEETIKLLSKHM